MEKKYGIALGSRQAILNLEARVDKVTRERDQIRRQANYIIEERDEFELNLHQSRSEAAEEIARLEKQLREWRDSSKQVRQLQAYIRERDREYIEIATGIGKTEQEPEQTQNPQEPQNTNNVEQNEEQEATIRSLEERNDELEKYNRALIDQNLAVLPKRDPQKEIQSIWKELQLNIWQWAGDWISPCLWDVQRRSTALYTLMNESNGLRSMIIQHRDLARATEYYLSDEEVIKGLLVRWLFSEIFSKHLYGILESEFQVLDGIRGSLEAMGPNQYLFESKKFFAIGVDGLIHHKDFPPLREARREELVQELGSLFASFPTPKDRDKMIDDLRTLVVERAMYMQELIATSTSVYEFQFVDFSDGSEGSQTGRGRAGRLYAERGYVRAKDLMNHLGLISISKKTTADIMEKLDPVCTVFPKLLRRTLGDNIDRSITQNLGRMEVLVTWGSREEVADNLEKAKAYPNLMAQLYNTPEGQEPA
ncbi:hypothetical protein F5B20DRAFT_523278 [Whalleya microplaca]|nr:hypothetical protein F5B20DRAFT_523278 [Whalleya microplaca]